MARCCAIELRSQDGMCARRASAHVPRRVRRPVRVATTRARRLLELDEHPSLSARHVAQGRARACAQRARARARVILSLARPLSVSSLSLTLFLVFGPVHSMLCLMSARPTGRPTDRSRANLSFACAHAHARGALARSLSLPFASSRFAPDLHRACLARQRRSAESHAPTEVAHITATRNLVALRRPIRFSLYQTCLPRYLRISIGDNNIVNNNNSRHVKRAEIEVRSH